MGTLVTKHTHTAVYIANGVVPGVYTAHTILKQLHHE